MTTVTQTSTHRYKIINDITIEYGATPDRHTKDTLINCVQLPNKVQDTGEGLAFDYTAPVRVEVFVRDSKASGERREAQQLIRLKKELVEFLNLNKHSMMEEGVSHLTIRNVTMREIDKAEYGLNNWHKLEIIVELQYRLKWVSI